MNSTTVSKCNPTSTDVMLTIIKPLKAHVFFPAKSSIFTSKQYLLWCKSAIWGSRSYFDNEANMIIASYTMQQVDWLFLNSDSWAIAFAQFSES
ncbi:hypothetical protein ACQP3J_28380, partial [Escherichia coli]